MLYQARDLVAMTKQQILNLPSQVTIRFEDGQEITTKVKHVIYSWYFWAIIREYPNTPLLSRHLVDHVLKGKPLNSKTHMDLLGIISKDVCDAYNLIYPKQKEPLWKMIYDVTNNIFNEVTQLAEADVTSIDILDFIEIVDYRPVKEISAQVTEDEYTIARCYDVVTNILQKDPYLDNNAVAIAVRADMVSLNQVLQCVSPIGKRTEVDGSILPIPVLSNFTRGLNSLFEYTAESRSAAKALYFSDAKLQDAEYFARRLQLLCMVIEKIDYVDCGSERLVDWRVTPPTYDEHGTKTYPGDLVFMLGKNYVDEQGVMRQITHDDPALHGQVLRLRSVLFCKHPDPHKVCAVCFGGLSRNVSRFANLGHLCAATMTQQSTQSVLSTKHLDKSSAGTSIALNENAAKYFTTGADRSSFYLRGDLKTKFIKIVVNREQAIGLVDILHVDDVDNLNPSRVSSIEAVDVNVCIANIELTTTVFLNQGNKKVMLSTELLRFLKIHRWDMDGKNNFVFDLTDWPVDQPLFKLPDMEYSYSDHSNMIARVIESSMKNIQERASPDSPIATLQELFVLVNSKINVNIAALEVIVYATMVAAPGEHRLGRNVDSPVLGVADQIIKNRSLGPAYTYEDVYRVLTDPKSFFMLDRPDSILDVFICPQEYIDHHPELYDKS